MMIPTLGTNWTSADLALAMFLTVDSFDSSKSGTMVSFHLDYLPINNLPAKNMSLLVPAVPVQLFLQSVTTNFVANTVMPLQAVTQILDGIMPGRQLCQDGNVDCYPFDVFAINYQIFAFTSPTNKTYGTPLPMTIYSQGTIQGFKIDTTFTGLVDGSGVNIQITISCSPITKAFSIIIIFIMWYLSGGIFIAAMSIWFRERKVEPLLITISTVLLFALPNVCNTQPRTPAITGTTSDMVGLFWNLLLVATSAISLIVNWVVKNGRDPVVPKSAV
ncbi:hypothetical protein B0H14DRAFT_1511160 [Mycena olivaceomarginata]|nr:hypothetical protein B0H14DRAFT_1511160 [Mycena olivaceomarginata]